MDCHRVSLCAYSIGHHPIALCVHHYRPMVVLRSHDSPHITELGLRIRLKETGELGFGIICSEPRLPVRLVKPLGRIRKCSIRQLVSYCTLVRASALTRSDTGICRLATASTSEVTLYHWADVVGNCAVRNITASLYCCGQGFAPCMDDFLTSCAISDVYLCHPSTSASTYSTTTAPTDSMDMSTRRAQESNPDTSGIEPLSHHTKKDPSFNSANISKWLQEHTRRIYV